MANPHRAAAVAKIRQLIVGNDEVRDKLIAKCINEPTTSEGIALDTEITANQMVLLLPQGKLTIQSFNIYVEIML